MKLNISALSCLLLASAATAFAPGVTTSTTGNNRGLSASSLSRKTCSLYSSSTDDEVTKLLEKAKKAREEAQALAKEMGREDMAMSREEKAAVQTAAVKQLTVEDAASLCSQIDFEGGDVESQVMSMDKLVKSGDFSKWGLAKRPASSTAAFRSLKTFPVSLNMLSQRTGGKVDAAALGVDGEMDVSMDDFKDATITVTLGSTALAIAALALLPENIGATVCYLIALVPVGFIAVGSSAPGIIAGAIASVKGEADDSETKLDRICRHEAGHFLCGYLCGLPVKNYNVSNENGVPSVEFHASSDKDAMKRELSPEEIAALSVVALSGSVAEVLSFGKAKGGENDLIELNGLFRRSQEFLGAAKQQDLTRWGALASYQILMDNKATYEKLVQAFKDKKSVAECVAIIESV